MTLPNLRRTSAATLRSLAAAALAVAGMLSAAPAADAAAHKPSADGMPRPRPTCSRALDPKLDAAIRRTLRQNDIPGAIVGFWEPGHCDYTRAFGIANLKTGAPMRTDLGMRIGSETKTFVATALLQLVDEHRVRLDDPISDYVSGVPDGDHITLRELAAMRSGLFPYTADPDFVTALEANPHRQWAPRELLAYGFRHPNLFPPGTQTQYSNTNYILLGLTIERVTHRPLGEVLQDCVIDPSHLHRTLFPKGAEFPNPHAHGYTNATPTGQVADSTDWNPSFAWAAGAMISDLQDLHQWARDVATGTLLSPATQAQRTDFIPTPLPGLAYGLGLFDMNGWIGHDGSIPGYQSLTIYLPQQHATLVVLVNTDISHAGVAPTTSLGKAITSIVSPGHIYAIPALT